MKDERERRGLLAALTCRRRRRTSAPPVRIRVTGGRRALITARCHRRRRCGVIYCHYAFAIQQLIFFFLCVCLFIFTTEQHIMETAHLSGVYLLRRRRHLQAGPLPQPKVRLSEGETVPFFWGRSSIKPQRRVYGLCNTSSASQCKVSLQPYGTLLLFIHSR